MFATTIDPLPVEEPVEVAAPDADAPDADGAAPDAAAPAGAEPVAELPDGELLLHAAVSTPHAISAAVNVVALPKDPARMVNLRVRRRSQVHKHPADRSGWMVETYGDRRKSVK